ncbi:MAG: type II secretion system GspH family protein [Armatimonadetes bacterium]|nr:type II secretion system GspH family protein [Armatimonadota bacterium]MDW8027844.1 type II secretion system protein [Armatimonadota bacterium]
MTKGQTIVALLVVILIIAIVASFIYLSQQTQPSRQTQQQSKTTYGAALERAKEVECMNNLHQIRQLIQMFVSEQGSYPPNLQSLRFPAGVQPFCPITKGPYTYDPNTGTVKCPQHLRF